MLEAADGAAGLRILQSRRRVDLLVTDVGLPGGMNGRQLADAARSPARPEGAVHHRLCRERRHRHGHLEPGMEVLTKPFVVETFASRVLEMIEDSE